MSSQVSSQVLREAFDEVGVSFYTGVPDSLLKDFCAYVSRELPAEQHLIGHNEGACVSLAAGHYMATGKPALVYMQNSGQGNAVNPLGSLAHHDVYGIPMVLLIGWRGQPGVKDEPQHRVQGGITLPILDQLGIPHRNLGLDDEAAVADAKWAAAHAVERGGPVALVVSKGTFEPESAPKADSGFKREREAAIKTFVESVDAADAVFATTGKAGRELDEVRIALESDPAPDFLNVGAMGHVNQIALGVALAQPERRVWCLDGDGAILMHMGALAIVGRHGGENFKHVVLNNGVHDSVGGQPSVGLEIDIPAIAKACGYKSVERVGDDDDLAAALKRLADTPGPCLLEVGLAPGARKDLGRPKTTTAERRQRLMDWLAK
jgi:phosphonopyruvate decarboxylase